MSNLAIKERLRALLEQIYGNAYNPDKFEALFSKICRFREELKSVQRKTLFDQSDVVLISYADQITQKNQSPLKTLSNVCADEFEGLFSITHILPFFPWSSDDGFSVIDFRQVHDDYGSWEDIREFSTSLMFDAVFNHISSESEWFQSFLSGKDDYKDFFLSFAPDEFNNDLNASLSQVVRPRTSPLLSPYQRHGRELFIWTTFSADQIDLDWSHSDVFYELADCLLFYFSQHASWIRLDAVPFLYKEVGTTSSHHPNTHRIVKALRAIIDLLDLNHVLITESNVPHDENIAYWGNGQDEAHMVYNFSLAPLLLHANQFQTAEHLHQWSKTIAPLSDESTFFNISATHDGIGVRPLEGIISDDEVNAMVEHTLSQGGLVSYKTLPNDKEVPYELNITWASYLYDERLSVEQNAVRIASSHLAVLAFSGVPAMYFHNLLATRNWFGREPDSTIKRRINRPKLTRDELDNYLDQDPLAQRVNKLLRHAIKLRKAHPAFHPNAEKNDFFIDKRIWSFERDSGEEKVRVFYNLSREVVCIRDQTLFSGKFDLLTGQYFDDSTELKVEPYSMYWITDK